MSETPPDPVDTTTDSILATVKQMLGLTPEYTAFDLDVITHINSVFTTLHQLGVGPEVGYIVTGLEEQWREFLEDDTNINAVKSYVFLRVRLLFDPPSTSFVLASMESQIKELEWRLNVQAERIPLV